MVLLEVLEVLSGSSSLAKCVMALWYIPVFLHKSHG